MNKPLVSVKTITYNHEAYIAQCIEGVLMQCTNFRFEYIIGEDCSTDRTLEIVNDYARRYPEVIKVITSERNVGACLNDHRTEVACKCKYVAMCEGDDYWTDPYKLQKQVDFLEAHPEYGLVHTSFSGKIGERIEKDIWRARVIPEGNVLNELILRNCIATGTVCMRKDLLQEIDIAKLIVEKNWSMGDYPLWLAVAAKAPIGYLPDDTMTYRVHRDSATHALNWEGQLKFFRDRYAIKRHFAQEYNRLHLLPILDEMYHKELLKYSIFLKSKGLRKQCIAYFGRTIRQQLSPWYVISRCPLLDPLYSALYHLKKKYQLRESL